MSGMRDDAAMEQWIAEARGVSLADAAARCGFAPKRGGAGVSETCGPCPRCGGDDRFSFNPTRGKWNCRGAVGGSDAIGLVQHVTDLPFLDAVAFLAGEKPVGERRDTPEFARSLGKQAFGRGLANPYTSPVDADLARAWQFGHDKAAVDDRDAEAWRARDRANAYRIWSSADPILDTEVDTYLRHRGLGSLLDAGFALRLRAVRSLPYYRTGKGGSQIAIGSWPAMVAAMVHTSGETIGRFAGLHTTYLARDGRGKAEIIDPATGEVCAAKKMRGHKKGCVIALLGGLPGRCDARALDMGEGNETTLSAAVLRLHARGELEGHAFWAACDLGNLGGPAEGSEPHPVLTSSFERRMSDGTMRTSVRPQRVLSAVPCPRRTEPVIHLPPSLERLTLLGDGDSETVLTRNTLQRARTRFLAARAAEMAADAAVAPLAARIVMAPEGADLNDLVRSAA